MTNQFDHTDFTKWYQENEKFLLPPVCNKLLHGGRLKVMFVGGKKANDRGDYHIEDGEEFFYMFKGSMVLKVLEKGKHRNIEIKEGQCFLLPPRVPHSPQRLPNSLGLVIERERIKEELDAMQWFEKGTTNVLWRRTFFCQDLGKDLVPIIKAFKASTESKTGKPRAVGSRGEDGKLAIMPLNRSIDSKITLEAPKNLIAWIKEKAKESKSEPYFIPLYNGEDFKVKIGYGEQKVETISNTGEAFYYQFDGTSLLSLVDGSSKTNMKSNSIVIVPPKTYHSWSLGKDAIVLSVVWPETT
eukprot:CAMPEP_0167743250 /NCGR_PEP_ID=MMETSP0110_2-20121227/1907_1 /TAXON_ID=629695 /ORGANISM="Gymnochlora sp., Strain CCMP2014" /LENGTH=298 /DNA_ID=CAMNT_0007627591 /DNA_START=17 /DNA_END=913 /DNA_ORIENTATION=+